jgi:hypothetical protein
MAETIGERALRVLDTHGWTQNTQQDEIGRVCMFGAIAIAEYGRTISILSRTSEGYKLWLIIARLVKDETGKHHPTKWNDRRNRTEEDVRLMIKRADHILSEEDKHE